MTIAVYHGSKTTKQQNLETWSGMEWNCLKVYLSPLHAIDLGWHSHRKEFAPNKGADSFLTEYHPRLWEQILASGL